MGLRRQNRAFEFDRTQEKFEEFKTKAPKVLANQAKNHFQRGFRQGGGMTDASATGWQRRKPGTKNDKGRNILVQTGALRRSIKVISSRFDKIEVGTTRIKYAKRHNDGLDGMPKREFIGKSSGLEDKQKQKIKKMIKKIFR